MKKCCENKDDHLESNWCFDPCDKERGYKIKRLIDECSGDYIYPVTSLDSVIININTLDADTKACLLSKQSDPCDRNVEITLRDLIESGCLLDMACNDITGGTLFKDKYGNYILRLFYRDGDHIDINLGDVIGDPFVHATWDKDSHELTLIRNSGTNPVKATILDKDLQIERIEYNDDGSISIFLNNGDKNTISLNEVKLFVPGYYRSKYKMRSWKVEEDGEEVTYRDEFPFDSDDVMYLGVDLPESVYPTVYYPYIYNVTSKTNWKIVKQLFLPSEKYLYIVSTGSEATTVALPTGEIAYFKKVQGVDNNGNTYYYPELKIIANYKLNVGKDQGYKVSKTEISDPFIFGPNHRSDEAKDGIPDYHVYDSNKESEFTGYGENYKDFTNSEKYTITNEPHYLPTYENVHNNESNLDVLKFINILNETKNGSLVLLNGYTSPDLRSKLTGDLDGDGRVSGIDLNMLINILLGKLSPENASIKGEPNINGDSSIDGNDLNTLINIILGK